MADHEKHDEGSEGGHAGHGGGGHGGGHGGGAHEEHEGAPEWLISFADNVALMMGFFVILLAMNMAKKTAGGIGGESRMGRGDLDFVIAIRQAFNPIDMSSDNPTEEPLRRRIREKAEEAQRSRQPEDPGKGRESSAIRDTQLSTLGGTVQFEDDSSALTPGQTQRAQAIAEKLKGIRFIIEVRGHASPSETLRQPEKGMSLGYSRSLAVARVLVAQGVKWEQIRIVACGDNERKVPRIYDQEADRENQRVNIVPTGEPVPDYAGPNEVKAPD